jgi:hypothetical protein
MSREARVMLLTWGKLQYELEPKGLVVVKRRLTDEGAVRFAALLRTGFEATQDELATATGYLEECGYFEVTPRGHAERERVLRERTAAVLNQPKPKWYGEE